MIKINTDKILTAQCWTITCDCCGKEIFGKYFEINEGGVDVHKCIFCAYSKPAACAV